MNYIAMNRFEVAKENAAAFEAMWQSRESYLDGMDGFISFSLLRGPEKDGQLLYSSHTVWATKADFEAWTKSEGFRKAHARAGQGGPRLFIGHPRFEGFEAIQSILPSGARAA
jgi:heme-degrading monooxygenase HmoA